MAKTSIRTQDLADAAATGPKLGVLTAKGQVIGYDGTNHTSVAVAASDGMLLQSDSTAAAGLSWASALLASSIIESETPAGTIDGANATFTLANTPAAGTLKLYKNGIRQNAGGSNDYTLATNTITFLAGNIPQTGDVLLADYRK